MRKTKSFVLCILHSEVLALWLGAALGTLNWLLFALLPLVVAGLFIASRGARRKRCCVRDSLRSVRDADWSVHSQGVGTAADLGGTA